MTSDAKIGLLLGLIFIFIIAFVINGLPSLRPPLSKVGAATTVMPDDGLRGIDSGAGEAVGNWSDWLEPQETTGDPAPAATQAPRSVAQQLPSGEPAQTPAAEGEDERIRSSHSLENLVRNYLAPIVQPDQGSMTDADQARPAQETAAATPPPVATARQARPESRPVEPAPRVEPRELPPPAAVVSRPANLPGSLSYVVVEGDTLPAIAKKMYGPEEGNRLANIERIFQANQGILKSPDLVIVGQKLIIPPPLPPLPKTSGAASGSASAAAPRRLTPAEVLPKTHFEKPKSSSEPMTISEKVESLARRAPAAIPAPLPEGRWYTVQEGDNLWRIAANQLGAGSRWDEVYRLNSDLLPTQESLLQVGMRLRLPVK
jgi:nucleoid-associated protein YgaU